MQHWLMHPLVASDIVAHECACTNFQPTPGSDLPSPYVKIYLLPDPEKQTKRKTKVIKDTTHPTYNELVKITIIIIFLFQEGTILNKYI